MNLKISPDGPQIMDLLAAKLAQLVKQGQITKEESDSRMDTYFEQSFAVVKRKIDGELSSSEAERLVKEIANKCAGCNLIREYEKGVRERDRALRRLLRLLRR